jgi:hypothetical protein
MPVAEGKSFEFESEAGIRTDFLETIEYTGNPQTITYMTEEFSAVCPFSGLPDIARVTVEFIPDRKIIELKSLKYYYTSFRSVGIYQGQPRTAYSMTQQGPGTAHPEGHHRVQTQGRNPCPCVMDTEVIRQYRE